MKKRLNLNNKGFAVSVILYATIVLIVLILFLILSILATITKNKIQIVDNIKEEVSGNINNKSESLGELIIISNDNKLNGSWHNSDFSLEISEPNNVASSMNLTYYYGTSENSMNNEVSGRKIDINSDTNGTTYYVKACRDASKTVCTKTASYLVRLQKAKPSFTLTGESTTYASSRTYDLTYSSISGIDYYQCYITNYDNKPNENEEFIKSDGLISKITINSPGKYVFIRAISHSGTISDWQKYNLYVN